MKLDLFKSNGSSPPAAYLFAGKIYILSSEGTTKAAASSPLTKPPSNGFSAYKSAVRLQDFTPRVNGLLTMNTVSVSGLKPDC